MLLLRPLSCHLQVAFHVHAQRGAGGRGGGDLATRDPYENPTYDHIGNDKFVSSAGGEGGAGRTVENPMYGAQRSPNGEQAFVEQADGLSVASPEGVILLTEGEVLPRSYNHPHSHLHPKWAAVVAVVVVVMCASGCGVVGVVLRGCRRRPSRALYLASWRRQVQRAVWRGRGH